MRYLRLTVLLLLALCGSLRAQEEVIFRPVVTLDLVAEWDPPETPGSEVFWRVYYRLLGGTISDWVNAAETVDAVTYSINITLPSVGLYEFKVVGVDAFNVESEEETYYVVSFNHITCN